MSEAMMENDNEHVRAGGENRAPHFGWHLARHLLWVLLAAGLGSVAGFMSGASYGGTYAPEFSFLGMPGYEGSAMMAGIVSGSLLLFIAGLSVGLQRRQGAASMTLVGAFLGVLLVAPRLFPIIAPSTGLLAVAYVGGTSFGAVVGLAIGLLTLRAKRGKGSGRQAL
jgi:hypothetical protein